jgi:thiosulfate reductase cytochrome b subunit
VLRLSGGFAALIFMILHAYMPTTGHTLFAHIKAMFTGYEELEGAADAAHWEKPGR